MGILRPSQRPAHQHFAGTSRINPFTIKTDFAYRGYKVGQSIEWTFEVSGGVPPYAINIDWGDGTNSLISQKDPEKSL
jgi:hypothetical protein